MKLAFRLLLVAVAVILVGDGVALTTIEKGDDSPLAWDPRVIDLARFVENKRELRFTHPVKVRFLTEADYTKETSADSGDLSDQDKADFANIEGELRALGLIKKGVSLFDDQNALTSGGTLAFYDPDAKEMVIRGTTLTVGMKVTVVHELTHALQDQYFDLGRDFASDNRSSFFQALGEGDAVRIENLYVDALSDADEKLYYDEQDADSSGAQNAIEDVSPALTQLFGAPYVLGEPMTTIVVQTKGVKGLNALFRHPPASEESLMNPFALLDAAQPVKVTRPKLRSGEKMTDGGDFGSITWYLMLAAFIDEKVALNATDGWGGDAFVAYRKAGRSCVRAAFVGDTPQDVEEMRAALEQWRAAVGGDAVKVSVTDGKVNFEACESASTPAPRAGSDKSLVLPVVRFQIVDEVLASDGSPRLATCAVREFFNRLSIKQLNPETDAEAKELQALGPQIGRICGQLGEV